MKPDLIIVHRGQMTQHERIMDLMSRLRVEVNTIREYVDSLETYDDRMDTAFNRLLEADFWICDYFSDINGS